MPYIHELKDWPNLNCRDEALATLLAAVRHKQGRLLGRMEAVGFTLRAEATLLTLTEDVIETSAIEGEVLDREQVRSSIARHLGIDIGALVPADRHVDGVVEMILDATGNYVAPLTQERLFSWHAALFSTGWSGLHKITVGAWRSDRAGPMQVVSGPLGRERVHFQAPAAARLDAEMKDFLDWFNADNSIDPVLKAGIAHLWFVTIHPFDDGNGRIARAIADQALARSERSGLRFYSMSAQIQSERKRYYDILEATQKADLDITPWLEWFLGCLDRAFDNAEDILGAVLRPRPGFNDRQRTLINRLLDRIADKVAATAWAKLTKCSHDTALRDIEDLVRRGILAKSAAGGRSTSYSLAKSA